MFSRKFSNTIHKKKRLLISILTLLVITLGLGYSAFSSNFSFLGSLDVSGYMEPTLYNVLKKEAVTGGLAREYTGEHGDSMDSSKSTEKIYHWYANNNSEGEQVLDKNNVIFADQCWQMIRTTDTGGVKMIYNGEAEDGKCLDSRGNHVGYASRTSQNLASNYWYGTDYTYDKTNNVFSISGTTEQATWNATTGPDLIGKYTCKGTNETDTCSTLYFIESYYTSSSGYVLTLDANSHYSQFGALPFNTNYKSPAYVGYMYEDEYKLDNYDIAQYTNTFELLGFLFPNMDTGNTLFSDTSLYSKTISFNGEIYSLDNPIRGSEIPEEDYSEYYTFNSDTIISGSNPYYLTKYINPNYGYLRLTKYHQLDYYNVVIGDSISDNQDGTYTLNNTTTVSFSNWWKNNSNYTNKYICSPYPNTATCEKPVYLISPNVGTYRAIQAHLKLLIAKERNNLSLNDTTIARSDELSLHPENYSEYKYTCGDLSNICTNSNLRMIRGFYKGGYAYMPNLVWGSNVTWNGSNYILTNPIGFENYDNEENLSTHHFMCKKYQDDNCTEVYYIYRLTQNRYNFIVTLKNGETDISKVLNDMLKKNQKNSTIKNGIDAWYKKNIYPNDSYVEDTIFCANRNISEIGGWSPNGGDLTKNLYFTEKTPDRDLSCTSITDKLSLYNNQAPLNYKVGLLTLPEIMNLNNEITNRISRTGQSYWLLSPYGTVREESNVTTIYSSGSNYNEKTSSSLGVRPSISLIPGIEYSDGNGSREVPYFIGDTYNITNSNNLFKVRKKAAPNYEVQIYSDDYIVTSFKLNGTLVNGDTFTMPAEDVTLTDIQYIQANYTITNTDNDIAVPNTGRYGSTINLEFENYKIKSFKLNGNLINGDSFVMPAENVTLTEITKVPKVIIESAHNPYANNINNVVYYENTFENATSITVELTYQTESVTYDWIYLYDSIGGNPINNKKYGGTTLTTETITVNSNYLKILFRTDGSTNDFYGFKAVIYPNYD